KMRRRVYEILMIGGIARLQMLDGLIVDRAGTTVRDYVWEELIKMGVLHNSISETPATELKAKSPSFDAADKQGVEAGKAGSPINGDMEEGVRLKDEELPAETDERWLAEDSFA